jgi:hypothetical protein
MSEVAFSLATREDDAGIRRLLARNPMPGRIRVRYEREPSYFDGLSTMGSTQVLVARADERVVGVACRAIRSLYINGEAASVGYLGQLRVDQAFRGRWLVLRGFKMLHELHRAAPPRGYVTTIIEGNDEAEGVLVHKARGPMPRYRKVDRLVTVVLRPHRSHGSHESHRSHGHDGTHETHGESLAAFLSREGSRKNFFPVYDGIPRDFTVIQEGGAVVAAAALWDQSAYKQTIIDAYAPLTRAARPFYNAAALLLRRPVLPREGTRLRAAYASFFTVADDDPALARRLIVRLLDEAHARKLDQLLLGLTESDPLLAVARSFPHVAYPAGVYTVSWDGEEQFHDQLDDRPRYLDIATL